LSSIPVNEKSH